MVTDRPWGLLLAELANDGFTGVVHVSSDDKDYTVAYDLGLVVAASSPLASDAAVRVALTSHLISSSQVGEIARRIAAAPDRDEVEVLAEAAQLGPDRVDLLCRRLVIQRAARTFSIAHGSYRVEERLAVPPTSRVDVRAIVYHGARLNLSEQQMTTSLRELGTYFVLAPGAAEQLAAFELTDAERPILEALRGGTTLPELEAAHRDVDPRTAQAVVYALTVAGACVAEHRATPMPPVRTVTGDLPIHATRPTEGATYAMSRTRTGAAISRTVTGRTGPAEPAPATAQSGSARATTPPLNVPRAPTTPPVVGRAPTPQPVVGRAPTPQPVVGRAPTPQPVVGRAPTPPAVTFRTPTTPPVNVPRAPTTPPAVGRAPTSQPAVGRTPTPGTPAVTRAPTGSRAARTSTSPALSRTSTVRRTQALIAARSHLLEQGADHFALLGVAFGAPPDAVRTAYLNLVRQLHPDKLAELELADPAGPQLFSEISLAFSVLTDPARREAYLAQLSGGGPTMARPRTSTAEELPSTPGAEAYRRGEVALRRDEPLEAVLELRRACQLEPSNVDYSAMLGWAAFCAATDKVAAAPETRKALERAIQKSPKPLHARFLLGRVERMLGRDREALRHFEEVVDQMPGHAEAGSEIRAIQARLATAARKR